MAALLPAARKHFGAGNAITAVDADAKCVTLASGASVTYDSLVSTMPLDLLLRQLGKPEWADGLTHSSSHIIGVGIRGERMGCVLAWACVRLCADAALPCCAGPSPHGKKCWLYFPEDNCPFYRCVLLFGLAHPCLLAALLLAAHRRSPHSATVFSLYAQDNCPGAGAALPTLCLGDGSPAPAGAAAEDGPYWSLMFEVSESFMKKINQEPTALAGATWSAIVKECLQVRCAAACACACGCGCGCNSAC